MEPTKSKKSILAYLLPPAFWLGAWQLGAFLVERAVDGRGNELLLPYPASVLAALLELLPSGTFWATVGATLLRVAAGLVIGILLGALLAGATCSWVWLHRLLAPAIRIVRATPVASFILLVLLWTGRNSVPAVISALMVLPVVWENLVRGIQAADPQLLELARAYRFSPWKTVRLIYLPSLRSHFTSGLLTCMGLAWKSGVAAEVICPPKLAIGTEISQARTALETPELFAWTLVIIALSLLLEGLVRRLLMGRGNTL